VKSAAMENWTFLKEVSALNIKANAPTELVRRKHCVEKIGKREKPFWLVLVVFP